MSRQSAGHAEASEATDAVFAALAHQARRQILVTLRSRNGRMTAGEIAQRFSHSWPTTTRHLRVLKTAGLVRVERHGRERTYCLEQDLLMRTMHKWLHCFEENA